MEKTFEYDDVLIRPRCGDVSSRDDVDISVTLPNGIILKFPLIASPMVGVVDGAFAHQLSLLGGMAILHRFYPSKSALKADIGTHLTADDIFGISLKIGDTSYQEYLDYSPTILLVDTANGYTKKLLEYCEEVANYIANSGMNNIMLMAGNVVSKAGCDSLANAGCSIIRVGIGNGSPCSTRNQTGVGIPSITAIQDCNSGFRQYMIVADGGIKNSGDFVKSIVAGADAGMSGRLYAECYEAPNEGILYGMASRTHMENTKSEIKSVEGFDIQITKKQPLAQFVREFGYGIKSAGTYLDSRTLEQMFLYGEFIEVTSSAIKKGV